MRTSKAIAVAMPRGVQAFAGAGAAGVAALIALACPAAAQPADPLPIFDAHVHYSHDAWQTVSPAEVIALMHNAGLRRAMVSSSNDDGTQMLYAAAPELIVPSLRPYRTRGEISTWFRDETIVTHLEDRLKRYRYAAVGEFHLYGADADLPVPRRMVQLARQYGLILHAHSDADAIERIFNQDPDAKVIWAHSGFDRPAAVRDVLRKHTTLWADLAYRTDMDSNGQVDPDWREVFTELPDRFMVGTDTFTPERLYYIPEHAEFSRRWLGALPKATADRIAFENAERVIGAVWAVNRAKPMAAGAAAEIAAGAAAGAAAGSDAGSDAGSGAAPCIASADEPDAQRLESEQVTVVYRLQPKTIRIGQPFSLLARVCPRNDTVTVENLVVDAQMPEHKHGMNYVPKITRTGPNRFAADGLLFHMPGRWQFVFDIRMQDKTERLTNETVVR